MDGIQDGKLAFFQVSLAEFKAAEYINDMLARLGNNDNTKKEFEGLVELIKECHFEKHLPHVMELLVTHEGFVRFMKVWHLTVLSDYSTR